MHREHYVQLIKFRNLRLSRVQLISAINLCGKYTNDNKYF